MSNARKVFAVALLVALAWAVAPVAEAQPPIRIGATLSQTGLYAALGQNQLRGYQLCVKHLNDEGEMGRARRRMRSRSGCGHAPSRGHPKRTSSPCEVASTRG